MGSSEESVLFSQSSCEVPVIPAQEALGFSLPVGWECYNDVSCSNPFLFFFRVETGASVLLEFFLCYLFISFISFFFWNAYHSEVRFSGLIL